MAPVTFAETGVRSVPRTKPLTTDRQIAALKPRDQKYDSTISGSAELAVRVYPSGTKTFQYRYVTLAGKRRRMALGEYPAMGLADARKEVLRLAAEVQTGKDVAHVQEMEHRAMQIEAVQESRTLADLAEEYWLAASKGLHGGRKRPKTAKVLGAEKSRWKLHIEPKFGTTPFSSIRRKDIRAFMKDLALQDRWAPNTLASIGGTLSNILAYAVNEDWIESNPATGVTRPLALIRRTRMFSDGSLAMIWEALVLCSETRVPGEDRPDLAARMEPATALALRLAILTLCRRNEIAGAQWSEIDDVARTWIVPAERCKSRRPHVVPLSDAALDVLRQARRLSNGDDVFPAPRNLEGSIDPDLMTRGMERLCERLSIPRGTPHDFRRTGATTLTSERCGVRRFVVSKLLGHASYDGGAAVTEVYDLNDYLPEKRSALTIWGRYVLALRVGLNEPCLEANSRPVSSSAFSVFNTPAASPGDARWAA